MWQFPGNPGGAALDLENLGKTRANPENLGILAIPLGLENLRKTERKP